jgi:exodeoxyribonuclease V gamma subunit
VYDGGFEVAGENADLCLARLWPDFAALSAEPDFADVSNGLYGPLADWLEHHITIAAIGGEEAA